MKKNLLIKITLVISMVILLLGLPKISGLIADQFDFSIIDPDKSFAWLSVHHIVQALLILLIILVIRRFKPINFGLGIGDSKTGIRYIGKFTLYFSIYSIVMYFIFYLTNVLYPFQFPMNARNIFGYLGFQLLLSGPSEELLFRAFPIAILSLFITKRVFKGKVSVVNIIAAIIFALAHIGIMFSPFTLTYSFDHLVYCFVLGIIYGDCFEKTKSVLYPMALHSISNVVSVGIHILLTAALL